MTLSVPISLEMRPGCLKTFFLYLFSFTISLFFQYNSTFIQNTDYFVDASPLQHQSWDIVDCFPPQRVAQGLI